jgi:outer membrane protein OmpA-like peptidoglycan-associated protein
MTKCTNIGRGVAMAAAGCVLAFPLQALELITRDDIVNNVVKKEQLVKVADNAIFYLDTSSSTNSKFGDSGKKIIQVMKSELKRRNAFFPDLGHEVGIVNYTDWEVNLPVGPYDRAAFDAALDAVPERGGGITPLNTGLMKLEDILKPLTGRTAVFVFWDGEYTGRNPAETAKRLANTYDVCFYVISSANAKRQVTLTRDVATLNSCSRVIPLAEFFEYPSYTSGALYDVRVTEEVVTTTEEKIVGFKVDDINYPTNEKDLSPEEKANLDRLGAFMKDNPDSFALIAGYTDDVGKRDYNEGLSRERAEMVGNYLAADGDIERSRLVMFWYGPSNPKVANDTPENQAKNRRVEIAVGLGT